MNIKKHSWAKWNRVAKGLGLKGKAGHYLTRSGKLVDFTACEPTAECFLIRLGQTLV